MTRIEEINERWAAVTPGVWKYDSCSGRVYTSPPFDLHRFDQMDTDIFKVEELAEDGIAVAHAPADIAALTAAIEGVLVLHKPHTEQVITGDCSEETCDHEEAKDCPKIPYEVCDACWRVAEESDPYFGERGMEAVAYPCPAVIAITDALEPKP